MADKPKLQGSLALKRLGDFIVPTLDSLLGFYDLQEIIKSLLAKFFHKESLSVFGRSD